MESADTGPFFHNHTVKDLESAVAFYGTPAFQNSLAAGAVPVDISADPNDPEVLAIAGFLRVLNALENIRSSIDVAERGRTMTSAADLRDSPVWRLRKPSMRWRCCPKARWPHIASLPSVGPGQIAGCQGRARSGAAPAVLRAIENVLNVAPQQLRAARSALANPATLPPSFRN